MPGHLEKRSKSSWTIVVEAGRDPVTGKRKRIKKAFRGTKREAQKEMAKIIAQVEKGTYVEPSKLTFGEYLKNWIENYGRTNISATTFRRYKQIIYSRIVPYLGNVKLDKLRPIHLQKFYSYLTTCKRLDGKEGTLSYDSIIYHHRVIHKALESAVTQQILPRNVADTVELPKKEIIDNEDSKENVMVLDENQVVKMLEAAKETPYYTLLFVAVRTGMRRAELLGLKWNNINFNEKTIDIKETLLYTPEKGIYFKPPKTKKSRRKIDISDEVINVLRQHRKKQIENKLKLGQAYEDYNLVFCQENGRPMHPDTPSSWFPNFLEKIGLPRLNFHSLRHTHASLLLKAGVDIKIISERLGHSSVRITYDIYSHLMPGMQKQAVDDLEKLLQT